MVDWANLVELGLGLGSCSVNPIRLVHEVCQQFPRISGKLQATL